MAKFRQQLKKHGLTPEKAYKFYDEDDLRFVFKNTFVDVSMTIPLEFSEEELIKIFHMICKQGSQGTDSHDQ